MKTKVAFVIDSTTIIPEEVLSRYRFAVVPLNVTVMGETKPESELSDDIVISHLEDPDDYKSMKSSSPSPGDFAKVYQELFEEGYDDLVVYTLSKELSGTYQTAVMAGDMLDEDRKQHVHVVNTLICNYGVSNLLLASLPLLEQDITIEEYMAKVQENAKNSLVMFTILDLKHLFRGGRLSRLSCAIGLLFKIKPVIQMDEGKLRLAYKMRTKINIVDLFMTRIAEFAAKFKHVYLRFVNLSNPQVILEMTAAVEEKFKNVIISSIDRVGPVFLVHLGNNGYGISLTGTDY